MDALPNELLLHLVNAFPLTTLLIARGVSQKWQGLIGAAQIDPIRRSLMDVYLSCVRTSWFADSRPWTIQNLRSFDRQAYINALLSHYPYLPESFRMWLLEWPDKAAIGGVWPGLPEVVLDEMGPVNRSRFGRNMLNAEKPVIWTMNNIGVITKGLMVLPQAAIPLFNNLNPRDHTQYTLWLLLGPRELFRGRVIYTSSADEFTVHRDVYMGEVVAFEGWVQYLQWEVERMSTWQTFFDENPGMETHVCRVGANGEPLPEPEARRIDCKPWSPSRTPYPYRS